jgi:formylmethanofuran dehydrogenase subunit E
MNIGSYSYEEFIDKVKAFHGNVAPGIIAGGIMVDIARAHLPEGEFFDVICETDHCLPDAVQILTSCTIGNGWLKIVETSRYALTFYNKYTGEGIRVHLDAEKLAGWPCIRAWFLKEKSKKEQKIEDILDELRKAGTNIYSRKKVKVQPSYLASLGKKSSPVALCPSCGEAYRTNLGEACPACRGMGPFTLEEG